MFAIRLSVSIVDAQKHSRTQTLSDFFLLRQFCCIWFFCSLVALHSTIKCLCYAAARCEWGRQTTNKQTSPKWEFMRFMLMSQSKYPLNLFVWAYVDQPQSLVFFKFGYSVRLKIKVGIFIIHFKLHTNLFIIYYYLSYFFRVKNKWAGFLNNKLQSQQITKYTYLYTHTRNTVNNNAIDLFLIFLWTNEIIISSQESDSISRNALQSLSALSDILCSARHSSVTDNNSLSATLSGCVVSMLKIV